MDDKKVNHREILEKGLILFRRILDQGIYTFRNREEMCDAFNFDVAIASLIDNMKMTEGKTTEELLELAKKSLDTSV